jgi:TM2 domain-containing membrane protein YozV/type II secretory pathway pseudopilin PulG
MPEINGQSKFCSTCGKQMHVKAEICPSCGVRAMGGSSRAVNKVALLLITLLLGGIGGHKFYQKEYIRGIRYLLTFWTGIPLLASLIEFIIYCTKSEAELQRLYPETSTAGLVFAIILPFVGIPIIGILAAIAIPQFVMYQARAFDAAAKSELRACVGEIESYYANNQTYPSRTGQMSCEATNDVAVLYLALGPENFQIITFHRNGETAYLAESGSTEIGENTRLAIESELAGQPAWDGGYGNFYFIE